MLSERTASDLEPVKARPPTFFDGVRALRDGVGFVRQRRATWPAAAMPAVIALMLSAVLVWLSFDRLGPWLSQIVLPEVDSWYGEGAKTALRWLVSAVAAYFSLLLAILVTPMLSAPALEHLVRLQESSLGAPERPHQSFWFELRCGIEAQLVALSLFAPLGFVLWLLSVLLPILAILLVPLEALVVALALAWNLLDYPLSLRGIGARARLRLLRRHPAPVLGFGLAFALASCVPGAGFILLPIGVVAATRLTWRILPFAPLPLGAASPGA
jgi:uncharacterized protein involved in cysteine biosynthesis